MTDISAILMVRQVGKEARAALASLREAAAVAANHGIAVEMILVLPCGAEAAGAALSHLEGTRVIETQAGNSAACRNAAVLASRGKFLAFMECSDLWGANWLHAAHAAARLATPRVVWHPEATLHHGHGRQATWASHPNIETRQGDWVTLAMQDHWTSSSFATRDIHLDVPYLSGEEGWAWTWNAAVIVAGCAHRLIPGTAHLTRHPVQEAGLAPNSTNLWRDRTGWRAHTSLSGGAAP